MFDLPGATKMLPNQKRFLWTTLMILLVQLVYTLGEHLLTGEWTSGFEQGVAITFAMVLNGYMAGGPQREE